MCVILNKEVLEMLHQIVVTDYEAEEGIGSWDELDKYAREDYFFSAIEKYKEHKK